MLSTDLREHIYLKTGAYCNYFKNNTIYQSIQKFTFYLVKQFLLTNPLDLLLGSQFQDG